MHARTAVVAALLVLAAVAGPAAAPAAAQSEDCSFPVERTDATGTTVTVQEEPQRVVTLNPSAAQTMWEIGAKDKVVGVTRHAMNLEGAASKHNISGGGATISNEEVVDLNPDLVLAPNTVSNDTVSKLRDAGLTVYRFREAKSIDDIYRKTRIIGELTGECAGAEDTVSWMQSKLGRVDRAVQGQERPDVIYTFFGFTAGNGTFIHTMIERAGGNNVAADAGITGYKQVNREILVSQNPDWIVRNTDQPDVPKGPGYNATTAVQQDQILVVNTNHLNRPAPRVVLAITKMAKAFHPDAYAAANATATPTPTPSDGSGPGFTAALALVALVGAGLLARRD